jgi:phosphoribosylglycinamide formyltransferase 1
MPHFIRIRVVMKNIVILFSGEGSNLANLVERLHGRVCEVSAAITNNSAAPGIAKARDLGIHVDVIDHTNFDGREAFDAALVNAVNRYRPDLVVLAGFMRILSPVFTEHVRAINLHPSLLPLFKGARAIERSFESDEPRGGVSVHWVNAELDSGDVIMQQAFSKAPGETLESFTEKIRAIEHKILPECVEMLFAP